MMKRRWLFMALALVLALLPIVLVAAYQGYELSWSTVDGGGGTFSTGGSFALGGTIGQPDAGLSTGGTYTLAGGFWPGGAAVEPPPQNIMFLPMITR